MFILHGGDINTYPRKASEVFHKVFTETQALRLGKTVRNELKAE